MMAQRSKPLDRSPIVEAAMSEIGPQELASALMEKEKRRTIDDTVTEALGLDPDLAWRAQILPFGETPGGDAVLAWPESLLDIAKALMLPGHVAKGGSWTPDDVTEAALEVGMLASPVGSAPSGALGMGAVRRAPQQPSLPMDEASRMARSRETGYLDEPFYRGQKAPPKDGAPQFYSRDPDYAKGFGPVREYRLRVEKPLRFNDDVTLRDYVAIMNAVAEDNPTAAMEMAAGVPIEGDWTMEALSALVDQHGDVPLINGGQFHQLLKKLTGDAVAPLKKGGFDAIDTGRDVRMLHKGGQRLKEADFAPLRLNDIDLMAALLSGQAIG